MPVLFLILIVLPLSFLIEALLVKWFFWALWDVGYVNHALDLSGACTIAAPLFVASLLGLLFNSRD